MTLVEAFAMSKETGQRFSRGGVRYRWLEKPWMYGFTAEDLLANDWYLLDEDKEKASVPS